MAINKFKRMARSLPAFYKAETNTMVGGLLKAWGLSDDQIEVEIQNSKDQLFVETADGKYLNTLASNVGIGRSAELGMVDEDFRKLVPVLSFYPKQVRKTIIALLDVFWGEGFTRANINSQNIETYNFGPEAIIGGTATFRTGSNTVIGIGTAFLTELSPGDYIKPVGSSGTFYSKVSAVLSDTEVELSSNWEHPFFLNTSVNLGVIRELEYLVNDIDTKTIRFIPSYFEDLSAVTIAELVEAINSDQEHRDLITASKFLDPISGNKLNIRTNTPGLQGSIQILGGDANTISRLNFSTEPQTEVKVNVFEINPNELVIKIPSSVPVLRRSLKGATHLRDTKTIIYSNSELFNFSSLGASSTLTVEVDSSPFVVNFTHASDFINPAKATAEEVVTVINSQLNFLQASTGCSDKLIKNIELKTTEGSSEYRVTGGTANSILGFPTALQQDPDLIDTAYPSAYIFDPVGQLFTVTSISTEVGITVPSGAVSPVLTLINASSFPNTAGKILFNFGRNKQEGPISYTSRPNNSTLLIDPSYIFQKEQTSGSKVNLISDGPTIPRVTGEDYPTFIVGTDEARIAAQDLIRKLIASGVVIRFIIEFPEVLFKCTLRGSVEILDPSYKGPLTGSGPLVF